MATDLEPVRPTSKTEAFLRRKFADLAARIQRVDLVAHLLTLVLVIASYALVMGTFDWFIGVATGPYITAFRWAAGCGVVAAIILTLALTVRCLFRRVNPYYVAHQLEQTLPDAKNGLINWLDLDDEDLPSAFQKNLRARAAEQWKQGDADEIVPKRKNWVLLGTLGFLALGLASLLIADPLGFLGSMRRAFWPIDAPPPVGRTHLTLLRPEDGDIEVNPTQTVNFAAKIEGRVPASDRPDAARLHWRYQEDEDWRTLPLEFESANVWTSEMPASQLRTGFTYKLSAGDAETHEHQVRVRGRAHIATFEVAYRHRAYRKLPQSPPAIFPNPNAAKPIVHGPVGSEVDMRLRTSRPIKNARVEALFGATKKDLPVELRKQDPHAIVCRFTLAQPGQFRVVYTATDGEENADREWYDINVQSDELPRVTLTRPGKDIEVPANRSIILEGKATSPFGVRGLTLQLRVTGQDVNLLAVPYRSGKSFQFDNGTFPGEIEYMEFVPLNQLQADKGGAHEFPAGTILEYWLEAADGADYPSATGNVGRSITHKVKLLPAEKDDKQEQIRRKEAAKQKSQHQKKQDEQHSKDNKKSNANKGGGGNGQNGGASPEQIKKEIDDAKKKLDNATQEPRPDRGAGKGAEPKNADSKGGQGSAVAPEPSQKDAPSMPGDDAGRSKDQEGSASGEPKNDGAGPKKSDGPQQGNAKGVEQQGPDRPSNEQQAEKNGAAPPNLQAKAGTMNDAGTPKAEPKEGPGDAAKGPGQARDAEPKLNPKQPNWDDIAKRIESLPEKGSQGDGAAKDLADIGKNADDWRKQQIAQEALEKNGRDPQTGKRNPFGSGGKSPGISDDLKAAAANREFGARIGQMQLDDWQKRMTPDLLKKAGMSDADWQRFIKNTQAYDAQVRALNAQIARKALKDLSGPRTTPGAKLNSVENIGTSNTGAVLIAPPPPELRDALRRLENTPAEK